MGYYEVAITIEPSLIDAAITGLYEFGCLGVVETAEDRMLAYFPDHLGIDSINANLKRLAERYRATGLSEIFTFETTYLSERDWNESWKKKFEPIDVGERLSIVPPWIDPPADRMGIIVDPGMAFGTGHHATTRTCLALIERIAPTVHRGRFLDIGTGTGILAIAAAKLGFEEVVGVDIDPLAIDAARRNAALNNLNNVTIIEGTISSTAGRFNLIAGNLLLEILTSIAPEIAARLDENGIVMLSGMIVGQEAEVAEAMERQGLRMIERFFDGERWVSLLFRH